MNRFRRRVFASSCVFLFFFAFAIGASLGTAEEATAIGCPDCNCQCEAGLYGRAAPPYGNCAAAYCWYDPSNNRCGYWCGFPD